MTRLEAKEREKGMYLAGLVQGREDAVADRKPNPRGDDSAYGIGYFDGFEGWKTAMRNEARKARKEKP